MYRSVWLGKVATLGAMVLIVAATEEESSGIDGYPLLVTGVGTSNCAISLMEYLWHNRPDHIINIGTAGSLSGVHGIFEIERVVRHDFDADAIAKITGKPMVNALTLSTTGVYPNARLATGDAFISDQVARDKLAKQADLVDMEGHVIALIGWRYGIPVTLLKQVSDNADQDAARSWADAAKAGAEELAEATFKVLALLENTKKAH